MQEMKSGGITLSQYRGGTYDTRNFLKQANPDLKDRRWGHAAIGWAYGQNKLKSGASFDSSTHEAKLDKGHADINRLLGSNYTGSFLVSLVTVI